MIPSDKKYLNDPQFRSLVDTMLALIQNQQTSFSEIREAALFAQLRYEMCNPRSIYLSPELLAEIEFRTRKRGEEL
jgi:hypothetical protein